MVDPEVTICIPVFNGWPFVEQAVRSALAQEVDRLEVVVVENRSTDGTLEAVSTIADPRLRVVEQPKHVSAAENWNTALAAARGTYVKLLCADDVLYAGVVGSQVAAMDAASDGVVMVASPRDIIDAAGRILFRRRGIGRLTGRVDGGSAVRAVVRAGTNIFGEPLSVLMRRCAIQQVGEFRSDLPYVIDLDFWCRLLEHGDVAIDPQAAGAFRVQTASWSHQLVREQGRQMTTLFRELHERTSSVSSRDLAFGSLRARALAVARSGSYRALRLGVLRSKGQLTTLPPPAR